MADKTTILKTKTNDNVYPNVIGDNRDNAIVDSAHIKHTLTADHKINFRLDDNVSNLIFNSLQKPAGLTKTKLVGVGTNGQENIEIGDNLTLANGKLSATGGGVEIIVERNKTLEVSIKPGTYSRTNPITQDFYSSKIKTMINITTEMPYEPKGDVFADGVYWNVIWYASTVDTQSAFATIYPTNGEHIVTKAATAYIKFRLAYIPKE